MANIKRTLKAPETYLVRRAALGNSSGAFSDDIGLRSRNGRIIITRPLLTLLVGTSGDCEVPNRRHLGFVSILGGLVECGVFCCFRSCRCLGLSSRFWQKLLEIFKKVRSRIEEGCDLGVDVLDRLGFSLIRLQDFEKLFVDFWFVLESVLQVESVRARDFWVFLLLSIRE
jgi:hypothetical protein